MHEICDLPLALQARLLINIQEKEIIHISNEKIFRSI